MPMSPKDIQLLIDNSTDNPQSLVEWLGSGGLKELLTAMNNNAVLRGIMQFADTTSMALAGGTDSEFAVCKNGAAGLNLYQYFPSVDVTVAGGVTSLVGGQWRPIYASQNVLSGVWVEGASNKDIVPASGYTTSSVAIGKNSATVGLILDVESTTKGIRIPQVNNAQLASVASVANSMVFNTDASMLLRYDTFSGGFRSASSFGTDATAGVVISDTFVTISIPITLPTTTYRVYISPKDSFTGTTLTRWFIYDKTATSFKIGFQSAATAGSLSFSFEIFV